MSRPTKRSAQSCSTGCNSVGFADPLDKALLSPRPNRDKVREQIKDYVQIMLGAPVLKLELDQQQLDACTDFALQIIEDYAPREYFQWYSFTTTPGQSVYALPPDVGYVREVAYKQVARHAFTTTDLGGVIPLEYMGAGAYGSIAGGINPQFPVWGKMADWTLFKQYEDMYSRVAGQQGGWEWIGDFSHIKLYPCPSRGEVVHVHYIQKLKDFNRVTQSMQEGALAFAKIVVGRIRSRIQNPPGGVQLDGQQILQEGLQEKKDWEERLIKRWGDVLPIRMG